MTRVIVVNFDSQGIKLNLLLKNVDIIFMEDSL